MARGKKRPETRRAELIAAAKKVFAQKGVAATAVSDIVKAASVAQGTFYLYFKAKEEVVNALAEQMAEAMVDAVERAVAQSEAGAVDKLLSLRDAILDIASDSTSQELSAIYHRPENKAVHHKMEERLTPRLVPLMEQIVRQGVAEGVFIAEDPRVAAWFILGGLHALEESVADPQMLPAAIASATTCALRALGCNAAGEAKESS